MKPEAILSDDDAQRAAALLAAASAPEHERAAFAAKLVTLTRDAAVPLDGGTISPSVQERFVRAASALAALHVDLARSTLVRISDEGNATLKKILARALRTIPTAEARAVLLHLLSDDDARGEAVLAIGVAPWADALPALITVAEADDQIARLAALPIAKCGASGGRKEANAAADFLHEQLDDDIVLTSAAIALLRFGALLPGTARRGRELTREPDRRKCWGLCLVAAFGEETDAELFELVRLGARTTEPIARELLTPLLSDADDRVRGAATRTWNALGLGG